MQDNHNQAAIYPIDYFNQLNDDQAQNLQQPQQQQPHEEENDGDDQLQQQFLIKLVKFNDFLKKLQLYQAIVSLLNFILVAILAIIFQSIGDFDYLKAIGTILLFQISVIVLNYSSFWLLQLNSKLLVDNEMSKTCKLQIKYYLCVFVIISSAGGFVLFKMLSDATTLRKIPTQFDFGDYDWIILSFDFVYSIVTMQIIGVCFLAFVSSLLIFYIVLSLIHILVWAFTKKRVSILTKFQNLMYKKLLSFTLLRLKLLSKFQKTINFNRNGDQRNFEHQICSICLDQFQDRVKVYALPCNSQGPKHNFHSLCLRKWAKKQGRCPYCRTSFADLKKK